MLVKPTLSRLGPIKSHAKTNLKRTNHRNFSRNHSNFITSNAPPLRHRSFPICRSGGARSHGVAAAAKPSSRSYCSAWDALPSLHRSCVHPSKSGGARRHGSATEPSSPKHCSARKAPPLIRYSVSAGRSGGARHHGVRLLRRHRLRGHLRARFKNLPAGNYRVSCGPRRRRQRRPRLIIPHIREASAPPAPHRILL